MGSISSFLKVYIINSPSATGNTASQNVNIDGEGNKTAIYTKSRRMLSADLWAGDTDRLVILFGMLMLLTLPQTSLEL
jgi:hypothetical protein